VEGEELIPPHKWLQLKIDQFEKEQQIKPYIPLKADGSFYELTQLYDDQLGIALLFMKKIQEFMTMKDLSKFVPLHCTILGEGGVGKTILINTLTSVIRRMFNRTDVMRVAAPTGVAACNVGGETLHRLTGSRPSKKTGEYKAGSMSTQQKDKLSSQFRNLLGLICDERSMLASLLLGESEQKIKETIYSGGHTQHLPWGGIPFTALAGDDYQLPPALGQGAIESIVMRTDHGKMTENGRTIFKNSAATVFKLTQNKRLADDKQEDRDLLGRIREGTNITDDDVLRIQKLHIDEIEKQHGKIIADEIKAKAVYLFWTNNKRIRHNLERLAFTNTEENPTAFVQTNSAGGRYGKGVNSHFDDKVPKTAMLCISAKVAITGRNFCPLWGIHNGACGQLDENVFQKDDNPNHGHHPLYTVVDLPLYSGPAWDLDNPKVKFAGLMFNYIIMTLSPIIFLLFIACSNPQC
jgi:GTPase SAR1 family protein